MKNLLVLAAMALPVTLAAQNADTSPKAEPTSGPGSIAWLTQQQVYLNTLKAQDGWNWKEGGLRWRWAQTPSSSYGKGRKPLVSDTVTVHYEGTFIDGAVFDSSYERGEPATFPLARLIKAWQIAIPEMSAGDTIEIAAPADLAYGAVGNPRIAGGATLIFKVELIDIK